MAENLEFLSERIGNIKGIGKAKSCAFKSLGIETFEDMLYYFPKRYEDRRLKNISNADISKPISVLLKIVSTPVLNRASSFQLVTFSAVEVKTDTGRPTLEVEFAPTTNNYVDVVFFNAPYLVNKLKRDDVYVFFGKISTKGLVTYEMLNPTFDELRSDINDKGLLPVYKKNKNLNQADFHKIINVILQKIKDCEEDFEVLPPDIREQYNLYTKVSALTVMHSPKDETSLEYAKKTLVFEELFVYTLSVSMLKKQRDMQYAVGLPKIIDMNEFYSALPFKLTNAQQSAVNDVLADMKKVVPMSRLVQGDVGSGKTMIAAAAAFYVCRNGKQACLMAPTEILANQHYQGLQPLFEKFGTRVELLTSSVKASKKYEILTRLESGEIDFLIGTHAVIEKNIKFRELAIAITDEQHRFGVMQRAGLAQKNETAVHTLVMSATPIPRTLSLIMYGDLDISIVGELPPGRQKVDTFAVDESYRKRINDFIRKLTNDGGQVFIVCPLVGEDENENEEKNEDGNEDTSDMKSVNSYYKELSEKTFPDIKMGFVHGKMKSSEKDAVMEAFSREEIKILVSTVVIEVGVNIPNAVLMIVENAERFGLSQLHQLRGRVGRGDKKSYCVLFSNNESETSKMRLDIMCKTNDGFEIARKDIEIRGPGDFFSTKQSGNIKFKIADLATDMDILYSASEAAKRTAETDGFLDNSDNKKLKQAVARLMNEDEDNKNDKDGESGYRDKNKGKIVYN